MDTETMLVLDSPELNRELAEPNMDKLKDQSLEINKKEHVFSKTGSDPKRTR